MRSVTVYRQDLLEKIIKNRDNHRAIFEEALKGYRTRSIELLEEHLARVKNGKYYEKIIVEIPYPVDHTDDYNVIISMLQMETRDRIEIDDYDFRQYVLDEWDWKRQFLTTNAMYSATAARLSSDKR